MLPIYQVCYCQFFQQ